ncbi:MAG: Omp28 family outer membrane lipoprotein [Bacteroidales bacterium]|nr:Omp28 family outer membrane lipoprotein [Bacteroidales bacterium]
MKNLIILFFIATFLYSCDVLEPDGNYYIADTVSSNDVDTQTVVKKVLLVDFTGIRCTNCPEAHETMHQIQSVYPNKIIAVAIHGTSLAYPIGDYVTDLRTDDGTEIIDDFGINAIPIGLVDKYEKNSLISETAWADAVSDVIDETPTVGIKIQNSYNSSNNNLEISIKLISLDEFQSALKLVVFVVEDSIITRQATDSGDIENYVQLNVFRDAVSDVWGDDVFTTGATLNSSETKDYSYSFSPDWDAKNSRIVAFVFDDNYKILNAQEELVQ